MGGGFFSSIIKLLHQCGLYGAADNPQEIMVYVMDNSMRTIGFSELNVG
jgi:hypothetical protein